MPRAASARLMERPRSGCACADRAGAHAASRQSAPRQQQCQQRPGQARADDVDCRVACGFKRFPQDFAQRAANCQASSKRLYSGTGATRMMSGERSRTPCRVRESREHARVCAADTQRQLTAAPRAVARRDDVHLPPQRRISRSRKSVSSIDFARSRSMRASVKMPARQSAVPQRGSAGC